MTTYKKFYIALLALGLGAVQYSNAQFVTFHGNNTQEATIFQDQKLKNAFAKELQQIVKEGLLKKKYPLPELAKKIKALVKKYKLEADFGDIVENLFANMKSYAAWKAFVDKILNDKRYFNILKSGFVQGPWLISQLKLNEKKIDQFVRSYATQA